MKMCELAKLLVIVWVIVLMRIIVVITFSLFSLCSNAQGEWKLRKEKNGIRAYTRNVRNYNIDELRIVATMNGKLTQAVAMMKDEEMYSQITPNVKQAKIYRNEDTELELYMVTEVPFPAKYRDGYFVNTFSYDKNRDLVRIDVSCPEGHMERQRQYVRLTRCNIAPWYVYNIIYTHYLTMCATSTYPKYDSTLCEISYGIGSSA